jgi:uncharacterized Fe-S cluster protein YjdI
MNMDEVLRYYHGKSIDVTWSARRCIHATECTRRLAVFDTSRKPWVLPWISAIYVKLRSEMNTFRLIGKQIAELPTGAEKHWLGFERSLTTATPISLKNGNGEVRFFGWDLGWGA